MPSTHSTTSTTGIRTGPSTRQARVQSPAARIPLDLVEPQTPASCSSHCICSFNKPTLQLGKGFGPSPAFCTDVLLWEERTGKRVPGPNSLDVVLEVEAEDSAPTCPPGRMPQVCTGVAGALHGLKK